MLPVDGRRAMNAFEALRETARTARELMGTNVLHEPPTRPPVTSPAYGRLRSVVGRRMLRFDYRWSLRSQAHEGTLLLACDPSGRATAAWGASGHRDAGL